MGDSYLVQRILGSTRRFLLFVVLIGSFFAVGIAIAYVLAMRTDDTTIIPGQVALENADSQTVGLGTSQKLTVNAQLQVNGSFYLAPSNIPANAKAGTLVFDQATNTLQYSNGSTFIPLTQQQPVPQGGVISFQGQTGAVTLTPGAGIVINGTTISNSGLLGVNGVAGDISVTTANGIASLALPQSIAPSATPTFSGLSLSTALAVQSGGTGATTLDANGVIIGNGTGALTSVTAPAPGQCLISTAGAPTFGACSGGGVGVATLNTLSGNLTLANASGVGSTITINDASTAQKGIAQFNSTNFSAAAGVINTIQNIATTSSPTFAGLTLTNPLTVANGGTGRSTLTTNAVLVGNGTGQVQQISSAGAGECLVSTAGAPIFTSCPGSGGVASIDGQTGVVTISNASGSGGNITIDDASTAQKGIAQFNSTNFSVAAGVVNTIQGITTTSSPTFNGLTLTSLTLGADTVTDITGTGLQVSGNALQATLGTNIDLTTEVTGVLPIANGGTNANTASGARSNLGAAASGANSDITSTTGLNTITPSGALTIGATGQSFLLQGNGTSTLTATSGSFTTTIGFVSPTASAVINFPALSAGTYQVCTTSGNCLGGGSGGANTALSNLSSVAINTALLPGSGSIDLGASLNPFRDLYIGNGTFSGLITANGGITFGAGDTLTINSDAFTDLTGNGLQVSSGALTARIQANKGLEVDSNGISLIDCGNGEVLKYSTGTSQWGCGTDAGASGTGDNVSVNGAAATDANLIDTAANAANVATTWDLDTAASPDGIRLYLGTASATEAGIITANNQTLGGVKTFNGQIVAGGGISLTTQTLLGTTAAIDFTNFDVASNGNTSVGGTLGVTSTSTFTGLATFNGSLTVETGDTFTLNGDGFTDLTGNGLAVSSGALTLSVQANKGLEVDGNGLSLIDCGNNQILKYSTGTNQWGCAADVDTDTNTTYTAGNDLDLTGTQFDIESQLDFVSVINQTSASLTLQTTTSGDILVNAAGNFNVSSGALTVSSGNTTVGNNLSVNGNTTIGNANSDTLTVTAGTSGSGIRFTSFVSCTALETDGDGDLVCGTDDGGGGSGDNINVNGSASTDANFINTTASGSATGVTWSLNTTPAPDEISITISNASDTVAGAVTTGTQTFAGVKTFSSAVRIVNGTITGSNPALLTVSNANLSLPTMDAGTVAIFSNSNLSTDNSYLSLISGQSGIAGITLGDQGGGAQFRGYLNYNNSTDTLILGSGGSDQLSIASNGATTFKNSSNSISAFNVQNASSTTLLTVDSQYGSLSVTTAADFTSGLNSPFGGFGSIANLVNYSEDFGVGTWTKTNVNVSTNTTVAPNGTTTADTLTSTAAGGSVYDDVSYNLANTLTFSVWIKTSSGTQPFSLRIDAPSGTPATGTAQDYTATTQWRRYHVTQTVTGSPSSYRGRIIITNNSSSIIAWGGQIVVGSSPGAYFQNMDNGVESYLPSETGLTVNGTVQLTTGNCIRFGNRDANGSETLCEGGFNALSGFDFYLRGGNNFSLTADTTSTSVVFSGMTTDITTVSNQDLTIAPNGTGNLVVGASDTTGTLLVVDTKTSAGDPTGSNGGIYYNSNSNKFRCYQNGSWVDCISTASAGGDNISVNGSAATDADFLNTTASGTATGVTWSLANGDDISISIGNASDTVAGAVTTGTQTFAGVKTFNSGIVLAANQTLSVTGGTTANRPGSPTEGMVFFDTDTDQLLTYSNGKWQGDRTTATKIVAASTASQTVKDGADYVTNGDAGNNGTTTVEGDQIEINAAITAVSAAGGGTVYLTAGTYYIDGSIVMRPNVVLTGADVTTNITYAGSPNAFHMIINNDTTNGDDNFTLANFAITGAGSGSSNSNILLTTSSGTMSRVRVLNIKSTTSGNYNLSATRADDWQITGSTFGNSEYGLIFNTSNNLRISDNYINTITDNARAAIRFDSVSYSTIANNVIKDVTIGWRVVSGSTYNTFTGNTVLNDTVNQSVGYGVYFDNSATTIHNTISNNSFNGNGSGSYAAVWIFGATLRNVITGNNITTYQRGIDVNASVGAVITNNRIENITTGWGINAEGDYSTVSSNVLTTGTSATGIYAGGDKMIVTGNTVSNYAYNAINLFSTSGTADDILVANNNLYNNGGTGGYSAIYASSVNRAQIIGNHINDTAGTVAAIFLHSSAADTYLADNVFSGTGAETITDNGTGTRYASQMTSAQVLQSNSSYIRGTATSVITGSIDPTASTSVTGVSTKFTVELQVGDRITVSGETRTITAITSDTALTVDTAFSDNANDTSVDRLVAALRVTNSSSTNVLVVKDNGDVELTGGLLRVGSGGSNTVATATGDVYVQDALEVDGEAVLTTVSGAGLSSCSGSSDKLLYNSGSKTFSCGTDAGGSGLGDNISVNGSAATDADFLNTTASGTATGVTWSLANGDDISISIGNASDTVAGAVTTGTQTFAGVKTFNSGIVLAANQSLTVTGGATGSRPGSPTEGMVFYDTTTKQLLTYANGKWQADRTEAVLVAASNSSQADKDAADYVANGNTGAANDGDQIEINNALTAASGKKVVLLAGTYTADNTILVPNNTTMTGVGRGTIINLSAGSSSVNLIEATGASRTGQEIRDMSLNGSAGTGGTQHGIYLSAVGDTATNRIGAIISNVQTVSFRGAGIYLYDTDMSKVQSSTVTNNGTDGIDVDNGSYSNVIANNTVANNAIDGIWVNGSINNAITNNVVYSNNSGIKLDVASTNNVVSGNTTRSNSNGIFVNGAGTNYNTVTGNASQGDTGSGIKLDNSASYNTVSGNTIQSPTTEGISLVTSNTFNLISGNNIYNSGGNTANNGIQLQSNSDDNQIIGNTITDTSCTTTCVAISISNANIDRTYLADNVYRSTAGSNQSTISDLGTNTRYASQTTPAAVLQSGSSLIRANASSTLTGTADPDGTTTLTGSSTVFQTELQVGDRITVNAETRTVTAIASNTSLTVDTAFSNTASASVTRLPAALRVTNSAGTNTMTINDIGAAQYRNSTDSSAAFRIQNAAGTDVFSVNTSTAGITVSGTLTVSGLTTLNGGLTVEAGDTFIMNGDAFTDLTGNGLTNTSNALTINLQANKGLEVDSNGLSLIDCGNNQILKYSTGTNQWACAADTDTDTNTTYTAGNDLDLTGTQFDIESQLDFVSVINQNSANLTLQTTTSGNILVNPAGSFNVSSGALTVSGGNTSVGGTLGVTGAVTLTSNLSVEGNSVLGNATSDTITFTSRVNSDILTSTNDTHDLGSDSLRWNDLFVGSGAVHIGTSTTDEGSLGYNTTTNLLTIQSSGGISLLAGGSDDILLTVDNDTNLQVTGTLTDSGSAQSISITLGDDANVDTVSGLTVNVTSAATGDADNVYGINIADLTTPSASVNEYALNIGLNWDKAILAKGLVTVGSTTEAANIELFGDLIRKGVQKQTSLTNITDIYVYDTTRDSDGGAWTNSVLARQSSWYTESKDDGPGDTCVIATDDRCDGSEFPKKSAIVATPSAVYIFDLTDGKMFMKFDQNAAGYALGVDTNNNPSGVFALNGVVYVGTNGASGSGMYAIDFTTDRLYNYDATDRSQGNKNIANRNTAVTYNTNNNTNFAIANNLVNDVHGSVINGAVAVAANISGVNGATLIAVATDASASVINLSSQKVVDYADTATDDVNQVWVTKSGRLYLTNETLSQLERYNGLSTDTADQTTPDDIYDEQAANTPNLAKTAPTFSTNPDALQVLERGSAADENYYASAFGATSLTPKGDLVYVGHSLGLTEIHTTVAASTTVIGWSKFYTTTTETGYMSGTPRAMFTMDDASGDITDATIRNNVLEAKGTPSYRVDGVHGMGMSFNGTNQYACSDANNDATCDTDADYDPALISFTIEAWFKHSTTITGTDTLIDHTYTTAPALGAGYRITMNSSGQIVAGIDDDNVAFDDDLITTAGNSYADGQWHHLVFQRVSTALTLPPVAAGIYLYIDGRQVGSDTTIAATATLNSSAILGIGADCSVGAACGTGANFWDGQIDDVYISMGGATSSDSLNAAAGAVNRRYIEGRNAMQRPSTQVTDATAFSSTTIGDSGSSFVAGSFAGQIVEITGGTGAGQSREIISNDATTFTVYPAWTVTPDATSDYEVMPEQLYGSTNNVTALGITENDYLGRPATVYVGTSDGSDGGGVTVLSGFGNATVSDVYHSDAGVTDDNGNAWSGTDFDDVQAIEARAGILAFGSLAHFTYKQEERRLDQWFDDLSNAISTIRQELQADALNGTSAVSGVMGADLAERYSSIDALEPGDLVVLDPNNVGAVRKATGTYNKNVIGIVATQPGLILGPDGDNMYNIALVGRVPVKVTTENGDITSGDRITSSSIAGYGMKATEAGRVVGTVLDDLTEDKLTTCPEGTPAGVTCGVVNVFVNLVDYNGEDIDLVVDRADDDGLLFQDSVLDQLGAWMTQQTDQTLAEKQAKADKVLRYLAGRRAAGEEGNSQVLTDKVATSTLYAQDIFSASITVDKLRANQIEGLEIFTNKIASLENQVLGAETPEGGLDLSNLVINNATINLDLNVTGALVVGGPASFRGNAFFYGLVTFVEKSIFRNDISLQGHFLTEGETPDIKSEVAAGLSEIPTNWPVEAEVPVLATASVNGNDTAGEITLKNGSQASAGKMVTVTFKKPFAKAPRILLTPVNEQASDVKYFVTATAEGFSISFKDAPRADTTTVFNYWVVQ